MCSALSIERSVAIRIMNGSYHYSLHEGQCASETNGFNSVLTVTKRVN